MPAKYRISLIVSLLGSLLLLGACGDGSDSHQRDSVEPPADNVSANIGFLVDSAVSGVAYVTPTHQGVTGPKGDFMYEEGETVRFMLGDTLLGEVAAQPQVTPFELAGSAVVTGTPYIVRALENEHDPFHAVINIATLLQSLDRDADPENGIEITPDVAALFQGVSLELSQHWETFREEFTLRHALGQANTQNLFSEAHGIANPAPSLQHLYQALEIDPRIFGRTMKQWDTEGDGAPDAVSSATYDTQGNLTRIEGDDNADGTPNFISRFAYDVDGNRTRTESDREADGTPENFDNWIYDAYGKLTRREREMDGDGTLDQIWSYEYDANGDETRWEDDYDADGTPEYVESYEYAYDDQGRMTLSETDYDADGTPESVLITEYQNEADGSSSIVTMGYSGDSDEPHPVHIQQYDASGNLIREESLKVNRDSRIYEIRIPEYDASGGLTHETVTWEYLPAPWEDVPSDGIVDQIQNYEYDAHGNITRETYDFGGDGTLDRVANYQYDANNHLSRKERISDNDDDLPDQIKICQYQYDMDGNLTQEEGDCEDSVTFNIGPPPFLIQHRLMTYEYEATGWGVIF